MPIRAEALAGLRTNYQAFDETEPFYASKLHPAEKSWTGAPAWWFEFPETVVTNPTHSHLNLLCDSGVGNPKFRHLRIPISFIAQRRSSLGFREPEGKYSLFLSADQAHATETYLCIQGETKYIYKLGIINPSVSLPKNSD